MCDPVTILIEPGSDGLAFAAAPRCPVHHGDMTQPADKHGTWHCPDPACDCMCPGAHLRWLYATWAELGPVDSSHPLWVTLHGRLTAHD